MKDKTILYVIFSVIISATVFFFGSTNSFDPKEVYKVYLDGQVLGLIDSKQELENLIDKEEENIKSLYNVQKVYIPNNLDIVKEITFHDDIKTAQYIYNEIKTKANFSIDGYKITIKGVPEVNDSDKFTTDEVVINVLDKNIFTSAVDTTINAFVDDEAYQKFLNNKQEEITNTGTLIEDVYIENDIIIKEGRISTKEKIFLSSDELSRYLLFGTLDEQKRYVVKAGDTIESVSFNNKLSVGEFLIINEQLDSANNLLYNGQIVKIGILKPAFHLIEEDHVVTLEETTYDVVYEDDNEMAIGVEVIKQKGERGLNRVTRKIKKTNGSITEALPVSQEVVKPTVTQIVIRGQKVISGVGNPKKWSWPTAQPYIITSGFEWRWGVMHEGLDIAGTGYGSPIYAANNGVIAIASYTEINGNYIYIDHNNGYYSVYGHMAALYVKPGQIVESGQLIGAMGSTGFSTGTHLHFSISVGYPYRAGSYYINPWSVYQ